ncbi:uncharacterized protein TEOVI_000030300 [Trypanosoma equiperdum]|uniref:Uncharacterized protein n=1 Tax=Trypanosoma equiperdum TaxID=5694 RepID=A0A1G4I2P2_TRYEQ|nr:hypothetical protein, conserved [Trypanosoma equiperdum]
MKCWSPHSVRKNLAKHLRDLKEDSDAPPALRCLAAESSWDSIDAFGDTCNEGSGATWGYSELEFSGGEIDEAIREEVSSRQSSLTPVGTKRELCIGDSAEEVSGFIRTLSSGSPVGRSVKGGGGRKVSCTPKGRFMNHDGARALSVLLPLTGLRRHPTFPVDPSLSCSQVRKSGGNKFKSPPLLLCDNKQRKPISSRQPKGSFRNHRAHLHQPLASLQPESFFASYPCGRLHHLVRNPKVKQFVAYRSGNGNSDVSNFALDATVTRRSRRQRVNEHLFVDGEVKPHPRSRTHSKHLSESLLTPTTSAPILELLAPRKTPHRNAGEGVRGGTLSVRSQFDYCFSPGGTSRSSNNNRIIRQGSAEWFERASGGQNSQSNLYWRHATRVRAALTMRGMGDGGDAGAALSQECGSPVSSLWASTTFTIDMRPSLCDAPLDILMTSSATTGSPYTTIG